MLLVHRFSCGSSLTRLVLAQNEGAYHHTHRHPTEEPVDVLIRHRGRLLIELLVDSSLCHVPGTRTSARATRESGQCVHTADKGRIAGPHVLLQVSLMEERAVSDNGPGNGNEDAAAYVSYKVDDPGDLIARFFRKPDIGGGGNGDEGERDGKHLKNSQPGGKGEGHGKREVCGGVIECGGETSKAKRCHIPCRKPAGSHSSNGHNDEQGKSSAGERLSGTGRCVSHQLLQELRLKDRCGLQDTPNQDHEKAAYG